MIVACPPQGSNENEEEIEELEEQIVVYRKRIHDLQVQLTQLRSDYEFVLDDRDELYQCNFYKT